MHEERSREKFRRVWWTSLQTGSRWFSRNRSELSSHAPIEETSKTAPFPARKGSRSHVHEPYPPSDRNRSPIATEDRRFATVVAGCHVSRSTKIEVLRPCRSHPADMRANKYYIHGLQFAYLIKLKRSSLPRVLMTLNRAWCWVSAEDN
jgi:hypothetical protein